MDAIGSPVDLNAVLMVQQQAIMQKQMEMLQVQVATHSEGVAAAIQSLSAGSVDAYA